MEGPHRLLVPRHINDHIDAVYRSRYRRPGGRYVKPMVAPAARAATLKLVPRSTTS
jgi:hypothetical protein